IPELGVIPSADRRRTTTGTQTLFPVERGLEKGDLQLGLSSIKSLAVADSFRAVLASIIFAGARERHRVLVISSAVPVEGKTSAATNLAVTLANMNRKVLLIDGDIRSPRLHDIFGLDNSVGVTDLLKQMVIDDRLADASIRQTAIRNLQVLTSGPAVQG